MRERQCLVNAIKVLIVEDEWLIAEDLKASLEDLGCEVLALAPNCAAALEVIWREKPDLAYVDTQLGSETCEAVLEECERQGVPVIISSGHMPSDMPAFVGNRAILPKPFSTGAIEASLQPYRTAQ